MNSGNISNEFEKLRSNVILRKVFNIMEKNKLLKIVKYNKKMQKRLNLSFKDYKEYCQLYSTIEIELKIEDNKYNKFINISSNNKKYYHIYFDDSKEEIKRNYFKIDEKIKTVKIIIDYQIKSFKELFYNCKCISSIRFKKFYRINIIDMSYMFYGCSSLKEINLTNFNTNDVINMSHMFYGCSSLKELNLTNFDTNNVIDMKDMFSECSDELKNKINLKCQKIFKTSKLKK